MEKQLLQTASCFILIDYGNLRTMGTLGNLFFFFLSQRFRKIDFVRIHHEGKTSTFQPEKVFMQLISLSSILITSFASFTCYLSDRSRNISKITG